MKRFAHLVLGSLVMAFFAPVCWGQIIDISNFATMDQPVNDLVYSKATRNLYASVPSTGGAYGNHVIAIEPNSKIIVEAVFVGSEPNKMAISDDGLVLYVGLSGSASVRRVLLDPLTSDISFGLGAGSFGLHFPEDIVILPGASDSSESIAVSRRNTCCSPRHEGVAIFDNGVMRPVVTPGHTGSNRIEPGSGPNVLYGYNNETSEFGFRRMAVSTSGVTTTSVLQNALSGYNVDIKYYNGLLFSSTGVIVDPVTNSIAGSFAVGGFADGFVIEPKRRRVMYLRGNSLLAFDIATFQPRGTRSLSVAATSSAPFVHWGRQGFAYRGANGKIVLFEAGEPLSFAFDNNVGLDEIWQK